MYQFNDEPVTPCWPMSVVKHAVCRTTSGGRVLGAEYAISVEEALKGVTIYAAYQYGLEKLVGSIEPGKKADFVLLSQSPLTCEKEKFREIEVEKVWCNGECVFEKGIRKNVF